MRRRRQWSLFISSPRSRRRLSLQGPAQDIAQAFAENPMLDPDARLLLPDIDMVDEQQGEEEEQKEEEEEEEEEENEDDIVNSVRGVYETFLRDLRVMVASPPPSPPPAIPGVVSGEDSDVVYIRMSARSPPEPVVRLPRGGFSYPANPLFESSPPHTPSNRQDPRSPRGSTPAIRRVRRTRSQRRALSDTPILRQPGDLVVSLTSDDWNRRASTLPVVHDRLERVRRQVFPHGRPVPRVTVPHRILRDRNLPNLRVHDFSPPSPSPLSQRVLQKVTLTPDIGLEGRCSICLESYKTGDTVTWIPCQPTNSTKDHVFHYACIASWAQTCRGGTRTCPECRQEW